jgi:hypothetical protein
MKKSLFIALLLTIQLGYSNDIKFGKVSAEEVASTQHALDPEANAAILYKKEWVSFNYRNDDGWTISKEVHYRIKVYNKDGFDWATHQVPLYVSGNDEEKISSVKGFTFNIENGKVVSEKLRNDGVFVEEVNKYRKKASITMPEVKEGSVLDIEYTVISPLFWHMDEFKFQYGIPADQVDVRLDIPEYFVFKQFSKGAYPIAVNQSTKKRSISLSYRETDPSGNLGRSTLRTGNVEFTENVYKASASNMPALLEEKYTSNIDNYRATIKYELASTRFPNSPFKYYSLTWEDVAKSIYKYDNFGNELNKTNYFEEEVDALIAGLSSTEEKAIAIFEHVKNKMTWDNYYGVGCSSKGIKKAYKDGTGNVGEINLMLTAMFRHAGLNANPVLVSTRLHGIPLFPTSDGFNYVVAGLEMNNGVVLFDATEKHGYPDVLPTRALNWVGRLIREDGSSAPIDLMPKSKSADIVMMNVQLNEDGSINGKFRQQYTLNHALSFRNSFNSGTEDSFLEELEKEHGDIEISNYDLKNNAQLSKPVVQSFEFQRDGGFEAISNKIYLSPLFHLTTAENPFKTDKREFPIDFGFPWEDKYIVNIKIPEGYTLESTPEPLAMALPDNLGKFTYNLNAQGNTINVKIEIEMNTGVVPAHYYPDLKEFYRQIVEKQTEKVVLVKA